VCEVYNVCMCVLVDSQCEAVLWITHQAESSLQTATQHFWRGQLPTAAGWTAAAVWLQAQLWPVICWLGRQAWLLQRYTEQCQSATVCSPHATDRQHCQRGSLQWNARSMLELYYVLADLAVTIHCWIFSHFDLILYPGPWCKLTVLDVPYWQCNVMW